MTTTTTSPIDLNQTMEQILACYPSAQRALFQRYHVGGCSSCGFEPTDTLAQVCKDHNLLDTTSVVQTILAAHEVDQNMQVEPQQVQAWLDAGESFRFIDVRTPEEIAAAKIPQAEALDYHAPEKYMQLPKDTKIVFSCKSGMRSMDVASYFIGHGFKNVFSMRGGIDAWRQQVDPKIPAC
jgi:rhodanese-related sulfurtransferase